MCETIGAKFEVVRGLLAQGEAYLAFEDKTGAAAAIDKALIMARECQLEREESIAQALAEKLRAL